MHSVSDEVRLSALVRYKRWFRNLLNLSAVTFALLGGYVIFSITTTARQTEIVTLIAHLFVWSFFVLIAVVSFGAITEFRLLLLSNRMDRNSLGVDNDGGS